MSGRLSQGFPVHHTKPSELRIDDIRSQAADFILSAGRIAAILILGVIAGAKDAPSSATSIVHVFAWSSAPLKF